MITPNPRIALIHDAFISPGGAENVLYSLAGIFPQADIYLGWATPQTLNSFSLNHRLKKYWTYATLFPHQKTLTKHLIYTYWQSLNLSQYQFIITSSDVFSSKAVITSPHTKHLCYCHTPPKYLYAEKPEYPEAKRPFRLFQKKLLQKLRQKDYISGQRPDRYIANSHTVKQRIFKYYRRQSQVIHPPVATPSQLPHPKKQKFFLYLGPLEVHKQIHLAIQACNRLKLPLVIAGEGSQRKYLESIAGPTVTFKGFVSQAHKQELLQTAKAFIFPAIDEDFGIAPVEAMGYGTPVIALKSGGVTETVKEGVTGLFFDHPSADSLAAALKSFNPKDFDAQIIYRHAKRFEQSRFETELTDLLKSQEIKLS